MSLRNARLMSGKSVADVMHHLGVSDSCVYQWETGKTWPRANKLAKLAQLYGCTVDELEKEEKSA